MPELIRVKTIRPYNIYLQENLLEQLNYYLPRASAGQKVLVITDTNTGALFYEQVARSLEAQAYEVFHFSFPAGEEAKNIETWLAIQDYAASKKLDRQDYFLALGGGVVGDLTGFAAATYLRGVEYIQIPTTLLAQIDSSVGGKTAINRGRQKNVIGAFKQPLAVFIDPSVLRSLPARELRAGQAELVKSALLISEAFFTELEESKEAYTLAWLKKAIEFKAQVVSADERDQGQRMILNLGHSFAHALEEATNYTSYLHGEAVALGLLASLVIGEGLALTKPELFPRVKALLARYGLPLSSKIDLDYVLSFLSGDKKIKANKLHFVILADFGQAELKALSETELRTLAQALKGSVFSQEDLQVDKLTLAPAQLKGAIYPPPSKSYGHRFLIAEFLSAPTKDPARRILHYQEAASQDLERTRTLLQQIGQALEEPGTKLSLDCGESGSTLRFLIPLVAALGLPAEFKGRGRLGQRPLTVYKEALADKGLQISWAADENLSLPLKISGQLASGTYYLRGDESSQYLTGLLFALPLLSGDSRLVLTSPLESAPYVEMSLAVLETYGIVVKIINSGPYPVFEIPGGQVYQAAKEEISLERDFSQAAFWLAAKFLGHELEVLGLPQNSQQGDRIFQAYLAVLKGAQAGEQVEFSLRDCPDLLPILALCASQAQSGVKTRLIEAKRTRYKESDRLASTSKLLASLGVPLKLGADYLEITAVPQLQGQVELSAAQDHRLAMTAAVAATVASSPLRLRGALSVEKSYPSFWREYKRLGGEVDPGKIS